MGSLDWYPGQRVACIEEPRAMGGYVTLGVKEGQVYTVWRAEACSSGICAASITLKEIGYPIFYCARYFRPIDPTKSAIKKLKAIKPDKPEDGPPDRVRAPEHEKETV